MTTPSLITMKYDEALWVVEFSNYRGHKTVLATFTGGSMQAQMMVVATVHAAKAKMVDHIILEGPDNRCDHVKDMLETFGATQTIHMHLTKVVKSQFECSPIAAQNLFDAVMAPIYAGEAQK